MSYLGHGTHGRLKNKGARYVETANLTRVRQSFFHFKQILSLISCQLDFMLHGLSDYIPHNKLCELLWKRQDKF